MKVTELISEINKIYCFYAGERGYKKRNEDPVQGVAIYAPDRNADDQLVMFVPMNAKSWFDVIWRSHTMSNTYDGFLKVDYFVFSEDGLNARRAGVKLSKLLSAFFQTPIDQRNPEPKYYLKLGNNPVNGKTVYLMKNDGVKFNLSYKTDSSDESRLKWTEQDIADLRDVYPKMASTIALIKNPVGDD